jgi:glycine reductase
VKIIHYINQFYAGIGGEEMAGAAPEMREGPVGPGVAFTSLFEARQSPAKITHTIICGDSYFAENTAEATEAILEMVAQAKPDVFIAGPAFNAGRYGIACGGVAKAVADKFGIPVVTGMYEENPGAEMYKDSLYIVATKASGAGMRDAVAKMAGLANKLYHGEKIGASIEEGYLPGLRRVNFFEAERGSRRAVNMLLAKMAGKPFVTEFPMPAFDRVAPVAAIADISKAKIAMVTSGGIVPKGNPDRIESSSASKYGEYDLSGINDLTEADYETAHGGYDPVYANRDSDRVLPLDILRDFEKSGRIGSLHNKFYTTVGNGTAVKDSAAYGQEIAQKLISDGVNAVILTST